MAELNNNLYQLPVIPGINSNYQTPNITDSLNKFMYGNQGDSGVPSYGGYNPQQPQGGLFSSLSKFTPAVQLGMSALGTLGGLYSSNKMLGLARDQFNHARDVTNTNLTNQIQSYNTALAGRARARGAMEGQDQATIDKYIQENRLTR